jgi:hypothetical protein
MTHLIGPMVTPGRLTWQQRPGRGYSLSGVADYETARLSSPIGGPSGECRYYDTDQAIRGIAYT